MVHTLLIWIKLMNTLSHRLHIIFITKEHTTDYICYSLSCYTQVTDHILPGCVPPWTGLRLRDLLKVSGKLRKVFPPSDTTDPLDSRMQVTPLHH